jgi:hypothetical protein
VSGSEWAIREEFVSIVVSNLPILQGPIRTFCNKVGLGVLFSTHDTRSTPFEGRTIGGGGGGGSYPLRSHRSDKNKLSNGVTTAWDSDEQILGGDGGAQGAGQSIVVGREVAVESECGSLKVPAGWSASVTSGSKASS